MPDLGKYATEVLSAYGVTLVLIGGLVWASWARYRATAAQLKETERDHG